MAQIANLRLILREILDTIPELPAHELAMLASHWQQLSVYMQQPNAQEADFYIKLKEVVNLSPTLVAHRFPVVLEGYVPRFSSEPGPNHNQPADTQGIPPVHNEVIRIVDKLEALTTQPKHPSA